MSLQSKRPTIHMPIWLNTHSMVEEYKKNEAGVTACHPNEIRIV